MIPLLGAALIFIFFSCGNFPAYNLVELCHQLLLIILKMTLRRDTTSTS